MRSQILLYVNRTLALIKGEERKAELKFLRAAQKWCESSGDLPTLDLRDVRIVDAVSDICNRLASIVHYVRMTEDGNKTSEVKDELATNKEVIRQSLDWLKIRIDPLTMRNEVQTVYPGDWRINEDSRWVYMVVGDQLSVVVSRDAMEVDLTVCCVVQSHYDEGSEADCSTMESLPYALANAIVQVVASPRDWETFDTVPTFDPTLIPEWLKEPLKEALRPEYERIDGMFRGLE